MAIDNETQILPNGDVAVYARWLSHALALVTQAALSSLAYAIFTVNDETGAETSVASGTLTIASTIYDTPQTLTREDGSTFSYNFLAFFAGTNFTARATHYRVRITAVSTAPARTTVAEVDLRTHE